MLCFGRNGVGARRKPFCSVHLAQCSTDPTGNWIYGNQTLLSTYLFVVPIKPRSAPLMRTGKESRRREEVFQLRQETTTGSRQQHLQPARGTECKPCQAAQASLNSEF